MQTYKIYLRSFAPWHQFGEIKGASTVCVPTIPTRPWPYPVPYVSCTQFGGAFHGDGRGFSMDTTSPTVTARVNAYMEVEVTTGRLGTRKAWCDSSSGPWQGVGLPSTATATPSSTFSVKKEGYTVNAVIDVSAANPLVTPAPPIDARGDYALSVADGKLTIDATITGDQFPACESFIEDTKGKKIFLGGFAPDNKEQFTRLFYSPKLGQAGIGLNNPKKIWYQSHIVVNIDADGSFLNVEGGGSGSNATSPACENLNLSTSKWNAQIMSSIPMPADAP